jgi:hypothetical protein
MPDDTTRTEVQDAVIASWRLVDQQQGRGQEQLFTHEATYTTAGRSFIGRAEIAAGLAARVASGTRTSRHVLSNVTFDELGPERARLHYLVTLYASDGEPPRPMTRQPIAVGDIHDVIVRDQERWLIEQRRFTAVFLDDSAGSPFLNGNDASDGTREAA